MWFIKKEITHLFGERLALDLDNAFYSVAEGMVGTYRDAEDFEGFKVAVILSISVCQPLLLKKNF